MYFQGTRDSVIKGEDSAYGIIQIMKCTEATRLPGYPECAGKPEMNEFLSNKRVVFKVINEQIDFNDRDERAVRYNEIYTPGVPIQTGLFSDTGYRYRYNQFERTDFWWTGKKYLDPFFDYLHYSTDIYVVPEDDISLAELYFRLDVN